MAFPEGMMDHITLGFSGKWELKWGASCKTDAPEFVLCHCFYTLMGRDWWGGGQKDKTKVRKCYPCAVSGPRFWIYNFKQNQIGIIFDPWIISLEEVCIPLRSYWQLWLQDLTLHIQIYRLRLSLHVNACTIWLAFEQLRFLQFYRTEAIQYYCNIVSSIMEWIYGHVNKKYYLSVLIQKHVQIIYFSPVQYYSIFTRLE